MLREVHGGGVEGCCSNWGGGLAWQGWVLCVWEEVAEGVCGGGVLLLLPFTPAAWHELGQRSTLLLCTLPTHGCPLLLARAPAVRIPFDPAHVSALVVLISRQKLIHHVHGGKGSGGRILNHHLGLHGELRVRHMKGASLVCSLLCIS